MALYITAILSDGIFTTLPEAI